MKSLDPPRAKKTFIRKKLGHTAVSAILISLISDPINLAKGARGKYCIFENFNIAVVSKTVLSRKIPKYFKFVKKMNLTYDNFGVFRIYSLISKDKSKI